MDTGSEGLKEDSAAQLEVELALIALGKALVTGCTVAYCHSLWSNFVRLRDGSCCVICGSEDGLAAHHIFRKSFIDYARFDTGNGISLCTPCHKEAHQGFNGKPDFDQPMDAQGGEKIEFSIELLRQLIESAQQDGTIRDEFYRFSDATLRTFKRAQSIPENLEFPGTTLEQAWRIWHQTPRKTLKSLFSANGFEIPDDLIQPDGMVFLAIDKDGKLVAPNLDDPRLGRKIEPSAD